MRSILKTEKKKMLYNVEVYFPCYKDVLIVFLTCITVRMFYKKYFTVFILLVDLYQPKTTYHLV